MEWSDSKVIRIENGDVKISVGDLRLLLDLLGVSDRNRVRELLADARSARNRAPAESAWCRKSPFRQALSPDLCRYIEYETEASEIRYFSLLYVPGPLQTDAYTAALTRMFVDESELSPEKVDLRVEACRRRFDALSHRAGSVAIFCVLDESVLRRQVGGPLVLAGQLDRLIDLSERGRIQLRMLPYNVDGVPIANNGSFDLLTIGTDRSDDELLFRENRMTGELVENQAETARHRGSFEQVWHGADDEAATVVFLRGRVRELLERDAEHLESGPDDDANGEFHAS